MAWQKEASETTSARPGVIEGLISGAGFALLFIALHRAGTDAGAWPLVPGLALASVLVLPFALREPRPRNVDARAIAVLGAAGVLNGIANLLFLIASGLGQLSIVAVLTALYPAVTILLARMILAERWNNAQAFGLVAAAVAISMITLG